MEASDFVQWWELVRPHLLKILKRYAASLVSVTDVEQDLAYMAWKERSRFSDLEHFRRWVIQRAMWRALDELRASRKAHQVFSQIAEGEEMRVEPMQEHIVARREISDAIKLLPPQQQVVIRGLFKGKSDRELAMELKIDEASVRSLRRFGRVRLQSILGRREVTEND